jgi:hypothetical protein
MILFFVYCVQEMVQGYEIIQILASRIFYLFVKFLLITEQLSLTNQKVMTWHIIQVCEQFLINKMHVRARRCKMP